MRCHAGGGHKDDAVDHGVFGWLCSDCWDWCQRFIARLMKRAP
jgi:hypothetical protein